MIIGMNPSIQQALPPYFVPQETIYAAPRGSSEDNSYDETWQYILDTAKPYFSKGYKYGSKNLEGPVDCSGFSRGLCKIFGTDIGEGTINQMKAGEAVPLGAPLESGYVYFDITTGSGASGRHVYIEGPEGIILDSNSTISLEGSTGVGTRKRSNSKILARRRIPIANFIQSRKDGGILYQYIKPKLIPKKLYIK